LFKVLIKAHKVKASHDSFLAVTMLAVADPPQFESEQKKLNAAGNPCASLSIRILNSEVNTKHRLCYRSDLIISVLLHIWTVSLAQSAGAVDTRSIDEILTTTYDATPGTAGEKRDWDRFRNLCAEVATLSFVGREQDGKPGRTVMTPVSYIKRSGASLEANGFFAIEIHRQRERFDISPISSPPMRHSAKHLIHSLSPAASILSSSFSMARAGMLCLFIGRLSLRSRQFLRRVYLDSASRWLPQSRTELPMHASDKA